MLQGIHGQMVSYCGTLDNGRHCALVSPTPFNDGMTSANSPLTGPLETYASYSSSVNRFHTVGTKLKTVGTCFFRVIPLQMHLALSSPYLRLGVALNGRGGPYDTQFIQLLLPTLQSSQLTYHCSRSLRSLYWALDCGRGIEHCHRRYCARPPHAIPHQAGDDNV